MEEEVFKVEVSVRVVEFVLVMVCVGDSGVEFF